MTHIVDESDQLIIRHTHKEDIDYVIAAERKEDNAQYVGQWTKEQHINALTQKDIMHLIIEDKVTARAVGYAVIAGLENSNDSIEFRRIVITDKGKGFGREAIKLIKKIVFEQLKGHRLWLDVKSKNHRAQNLYKSEGLTREGVLRECIFCNGNYESLILMSILKNEYNNINC